jgi:D-3-phosphoglycerate dehydrogenase
MTQRVPASPVPSSASPCVYVGPDPSPRIEAAVREGGGVPCANAGDAQAIVWLSKGVNDLAALLHPGIRWLQLPDAGVDRWLDAGLGTGPWVVTSARGTFGPQVAEQALALLLAGARRLHVSARERAWPAERYWGISLRRRTVAVVGAGDIGGCLLDLLRPLGARTVAVTRRGLPVASADVTYRLEALSAALDGAHALVLAAPGTAQNRHLIGRAELDLMSKGALLVNVGRGTLLDHDALLAALDDGQVGFAGLDVTDPEPLPPEHSLWRHESALITPHVANTPEEKVVSLAPRVRENTRRFVEQRELEAVVDTNLGH